jgi:hypothetical protein
VWNPLSLKISYLSSRWRTLRKRPGFWECDRGSDPRCGPSQGISSIPPIFRTILRRSPGKIRTVTDFGECGQGTVYRRGRGIRSGNGWIEDPFGWNT